MAEEVTEDVIDDSTIEAYTSYENGEDAGVSGVSVTDEKPNTDIKVIPSDANALILMDTGAQSPKGVPGQVVKIVLPLAVPGLISAGIFAFTLSWNEFIYALTFISSSEVKTVPVGVITELVEGDVYHWGSLMAGALLGSLPVAVLYSFFVEYYVSGLTGAVKE